MKRLILAIAIIAGVTFAVPTFAQVGQGLSGPHYNLNIIGVPKGKTVDMTDSSRHTIFVPLSGNAKITYVAGTEFQVLDGTAPTPTAARSKSRASRSATSATTSLRPASESRTPAR